jgi:disulfide bond formation protein DsbB
VQSKTGCPLGLAQTCASLVVMTALNRRLADWQALLAALASGLMLAVAHAFETFGGLAPCTLCLKQREVYWAALGFGLAGAAVYRLTGSERARRGAAAVLTVIFVYGAYLAAFHAGAEWKWWPGPSTCSGAAGTVTLDSMTALLNGAKLKPPRCDEAAWVWLGLSMAGWNCLVSLGLAGFSAACALTKKAQS